MGVGGGGPPDGWGGGWWWRVVPGSGWGIVCLTRPTRPTTGDGVPRRRRPRRVVTGDDPTGTIPPGAVDDGDGPRGPSGPSSNGGEPNGGEGRGRLRLRHRAPRRTGRPGNVPADIGSGSLTGCGILPRRTRSFPAESLPLFIALARFASSPPSGWGCEGSVCSGVHRSEG